MKYKGGGINDRENFGLYFEDFSKSKILEE